MEFKLPNTIEQNIQHFTGRTWLLPQLLKWLEQTEERMFILTGEPGTGKSMIVAWLAGAGPLPEDAEARVQLEQIRSLVKAVHFCVAASGSVSPTNFAENVANQLTHNVSGFGDALAATLEDRVQISTVQQVGKMEAGSSVTGVHIERLELDGLGEELSFEQALHRPLQKLCANGYNKPILLLVDALDEAATYTGKIDLVRLLKKLSDLPQNVRVLVTTRPDPRVLKFYKKVKPFNLLTDAPENVNDARLYAYERLGELDHEQRTRLSDRIAQAAQGIFLYAHVVINDLLARLPEIPDLDAVSMPKGLRGLYHDFLNRELGTDEDRWYAMFKPLLGLIAVAQGEGVTQTQIEHILSKDVEQPLRICKQYLSGNLPDGPFRPFHQSFVDFLLRDEENVDYHIDAVQMHRQIADYYLKEYGSHWKDCDLYGLRYLPTHQIQAELWEGVEQVLTNLHFIEAKCAAGMTYDLISDYNAALDGLPDPDAQRERAEKQQRDARIQEYTYDLIAYSKGEIQELEIIKSVEPWSEEKIKADIERIKNNPTRLDRIRAFAQFVNAGSHVLAKFAVHPGFVIQHAYNSANFGPVARSAEGLVTTDQEHTLLLLHHPSQRPAYNPHPALLKILVGHTDVVESVRVTPDGERAVSGSWDHTVRVWDLERGVCLHTLTGHTNEVSSVSLTPDGRRSVSGNKDGTVRVWDLERGICLHCLDMLSWPPRVHVVSLTPDGRCVVLGSENRTIRVWDLEREICLHTLTGHTDGVESVSLTPDGRRAVSGSGDETVRVWDLDQGVCLHTLTGHTSTVKSVSLTPDGRRAVSGSLDKTMRVWDLECGICLHTFTGHTDEVSSVSLTPDGRRAVSLNRDIDNSTMRVWDLEQGRCLHTFTDPTRSLFTSVSFTPDGRRAVSGSGDRTVRVWDLERGSCLHTLTGHTDGVKSVGLTPDGRRAVSRSLDKTMRVWDLECGSCLHTLTGHTGEVLSVGLTPDGRRAISRSLDKTMRVWDLECGSCLHTLTGHTGEVLSVSLTPDGRRAVSGSLDKTMRVWDLECGICLHTLTGYTDEVDSVSLTPDGRRAISLSRYRGNGDMRVWDLEHGRCLYTLKGVWRVSVTPDGRCAVLDRNDLTVWVWDLIRGTCIGIYQARGIVTSLSAISSRKYLVCGTDTRANASK